MTTNATIDGLRAAGYNLGAATWIAEQIAAGKGTLDQWVFSTINLKRLKALNEEHADYTGAPAAQGASNE